MGYESKIYFCKDYGFPEGKLHHSQVVAMIDMDKLGYYKSSARFNKLFDTETPFSIYIEGYNEEKEVEQLQDKVYDCYGDRICYCSDIDALIETVDSLIKEREEEWKKYSGKNYKDYRCRQLKAMLKAFKSDPEIYVVHYGY